MIRLIVKKKKETLQYFDKFTCIGIGCNVSSYDKIQNRRLVPVNAILLCVNL